MKRISQLAAFLATALSFGAHAQQGVGQAIVIEDATIASPDPSDGRRRLRTSMVVDVFERTDTMALVRRQFGLTAKGWIPRAAIVEPGAFERVYKWNGARTIAVYSDSGDSGRTYDLWEDGTFRSVHSTIERKIEDAGSLYRYGSVMWARPKHAKASELDPWSFFRIGGKGSLCNFPDEGDCPE